MCCFVKRVFLLVFFCGGKGVESFFFHEIKSNNFK